MSHPSPLARLWTYVANALSRLRATIAPLDVLLANERRALRTHLRALEVFCRRLALTEALKLGDTRAPANTRPKSPPPARACVSRKLAPTLRLWPRPRPMPVRITLLGRPTSMREIWKEQRRAALAARLAQARRRRQPAHLRLADRIDALQSFLDAPRAHLRRLARKLRRTPKLGFAIATRRAPASAYLAPEIVSFCAELCWSAFTDTS